MGFDSDVPRKVTTSLDPHDDDHELGADHSSGDEPDRPGSASLVDAHAAVDDAPLKDSVSESAEERSFLIGLRRNRNETIAREAFLGSSVAIVVGMALWMGYGAPDESKRAVVAEQADVAGAEPGIAPGRAPIGPPAPPTVEGNLPRTAVNDAISRQGSQLRRCFAPAFPDTGFARDPSGSSVVTMKLLVGESGDVIGVADLGAGGQPRGPGDRAVVNCVARSMRALSFPPPQGGRALVTYPIEPPR